MNHKRLIFFSLLCAVLVSCTSKQRSADTSAGSSAAANFILQAADGSTVELSKLQGKVVVLNFWATWCGPCRAEMPGMTKVYDRLKGRGLEIIGVSLDRGGWGDVRPFLARNTINYPIVVGDAEIAKAYKLPDAIPFTVFINRGGNIVKNHMGYLSEEAFEQEVQKLL